ncbi:GFA family protein [Lichenibacterium dinghuense]|uniref:GFA family protein n=1 Tax=Lichenibacterium dinghuense TaxID=2895977 RepID=UPI001F406515|nr:GFA family protein [Lichenibacterium sp. 6Y81]
MPDAAGPAGRLAGRCFCGRVGYEVADAFRYAMYCHCSLCRRRTGSAFKALAGIEAGALTLKAEAADVATLGGDGWHDVSCRRCGSLLYAVVRGGGFVHVAMGTLVDEPAIRPSMHVFVGSKAPWYEIADDLPRFDGAPPA